MILSKTSYYNRKTPGRTQAHVVVTSQQQTSKPPERVETLPDLEVGEILGNKKAGRISPVPKLKPKVAGHSSPGKGKIAKNEGDKKG